MDNSLKIILVDDDEVDRGVLRRYIKAFPGENFSVLEFDSGKAGLAYCNQQKPDCMLLDYSLPDLNGLEFISQLADPAFPILMLTGQGDESIAVEAMKSGVQDYLVKDGLNPTHLMSAINSAIKINQVEKDRKRAEEALVSANEELEIRVRERTSSLEEANKKLVVAKEIAETANRAKSIFLSKMSHELRTPMHSILGFTQLLLLDNKNPLADYQRYNMETVIKAGNHLLDLINETLDLSKIESGKNDLKIGVFDINSIVASVIEVFKPLCDEKRIAIQFDVPENETCFAKVDPLRFKQVMFNLISNAIKFNKPHGSVMISLEKQEGNSVRLGLKDNGFGISEEKQDRIFMPFERLDTHSENSDNIEGTGIGLTLTKKFVELMGGSIGLESVEGEGSLFYIDIPI